MDNQDLRINLRTIDTSSLVDKVEMRLIEVFLYRELQAGDSIPKETELATLMGVSRTVIRESLNRLKTIDLIESKKHLGTIIKSPDLSSILRKSIIPRILDHKTLMNIFENPLPLEVGMSDLMLFAHWACLSHEYRNRGRIPRGNEETPEKLLSQDPFCRVVTVL